MTASVTFNPYLQSVGNAGLFNTESSGFRQGTAYPDPSTRFRLRGGYLANTETLPMYGGVGIYASVPGGAGNPNVSLGSPVGRATTLSATSATGLAGFSVFDQAYGMITSPQQPVPVAGAYGQVAFYPLGSLARIAVACDPALVDLRGGPIGAQVSWDFQNQLLVPYQASAFTIVSGTYNNTTGIVALTLSGAPSNPFSAGDDLVISSLTGTGAFASLNGNYTAISPTSGTTVTYQTTAGLGASAITGGSLTLGSGSASALNVKVLEVKSTNCETVQLVGPFYTWNYNGSCALIQI